jgi:NAD dependent epimerase/dehydratase family enzyme
VLVTPSIEGALNLTAPSPVTNAEFGATLARLLHRPFVAHVPAFVLRVALGELADALLTGQRAHPERALAGGFQFRWPTLEPALRDLLRLSGAGR